MSKNHPTYETLKRRCNRAVRACRAVAGLMEALDRDNAVRLPYSGWDEVQAAVGIVVGENKDVPQ